MIPESRYNGTIVNNALNVINKEIENEEKGEDIPETWFKTNNSPNYFDQGTSFASSNTEAYIDHIQKRAECFIPKYSLVFVVTASHHEQLAEIIEQPEEIIEQLDSIREAFGLTKSQAASVLQVSRPTFYSWEDGVQPQLEKLRRIETLNSLAQMVPSQAHRFIKNYLNRKINNSKSLYELLAESVLDIERIKNTTTKIISLVEKGIATMKTPNSTSNEKQPSKRDMERNQDRFSRPV